MKQTKLSCWIVAAMMAVSGMVLMAQGFRKAEHPESISQREEMRTRRMNVKTHAAPGMSKSRFQNRVSEKEAPTLRGLVVSSEPAYVCEFKAEPGLTISNIHSAYSMPDASGGAFYANGKFYVMTFCEEFVGEYSTLMTVYDAATWDELEVKEDLLPTSSGYCMTYDPLTDAVYGYFQNDTLDPTWVLFGRLNLATGEVAEVNSVDSEECFVAIAAATDGFLYGINKNGVYCRITKRGEITKLGHTDVKPAYVQSATIDPATGNFYWAGFTDEGHGGLYVVDPTTYMAQLIQEFPENQEIVGLYVVENSTEAEMPVEVSDMEMNFINDSYNGTVSFTTPDRYGNGTSIDKPMTAHVAIDGNHYEVASVEPGSEITIDVQVHAEGLYNAAAWVTVGESASNKSFVQKWIGPDQPTSVHDLMIKAEGSKVTINWTAPSEGIHGGWLDPSRLAYVISRSGYGNLHVMDYKDTVFTDEFDESVSADVRYMVRATNGFYGGTISYTDWVHVGPDILEVPFSLSPNSDYGKFTVVDANEDGNTWETSYAGYAVYKAGNITADDWMISPEIQLEAGVVYQLEYRASAKMGLLTPETIEFNLGMGRTPDAMTTQIDEQTLSTVGINNFTTFIATFSVGETGLYNLGIHAKSDKGSQMGLGAFTVSSLAASSAPLASSDMRVIPAEKGALEATVSFRLPSKDSNGNNLEYISKVELYNGDRMAASASNLVPGEECTLNDNNPHQGMNAYSIIAYGKDGAKGLTAEVSGWVGVDVPSLPTDLDIVEIEGGAKVNWTPSASGLNGGYVNMDEVTYTVVDTYSGSPIVSVTGDNEATVYFGPLKSQTGLSLGLMVQNSAGVNNDYAMTPTILVGPAYTLPLHEHFGGNTDYMWVVQGNKDDGEIAGWIPEETVGFDGLIGKATYYGEYSWDSQKLTSGKIEIPRNSSPTLRMWVKYIAGGETGGKFNVLISESYGKGYKPIYTDEITTSTDTSWHGIEVSLAEYAGKTVYLALEGVPNDEGRILIGVDDLKLGQALEYDAWLSLIALDKEDVEIGQDTANVTVWVGNEGKMPMLGEDYTVDFYANDRKFESLPGKSLEALFGHTSFMAQYRPTTDDSATTKISAVVNYDLDRYPSNNTSESRNVYVVIPDLPTASGLSAKYDNEGGVILEWTEADQSGLPIRTVTDDFESYRTWAQNYVGKWNIVDEDQGTGTKTSYFFPGSNGSLGWMVMEPREIPIGFNGETHADRQSAYSGEKYMIAFNPHSGVDNKDWLITPLLSGNEQTVSFMARAESFDAGREMFEVYYSTTGNDIQDMIRLDDTVYRTESKGWSEFRFKVPAGTKYFAVRCVSHNRLAMHIDDFTYESAPTPVEGKLIGYNIYCNGMLINDEPTAATIFRHTSPTDGSNTYYVRAVYDKGEAPASESVTLDLSEVEILPIDSRNDKFYDLNGIPVTNMEKGHIYVGKGKRIVGMNK